MGRIGAIYLIMDDSKFVEINKVTVIYAIGRAPILVEMYILKKRPVAYLIGIFIVDYTSI